jgi:hypothetical protein
LDATLIADPNSRRKNQQGGIHHTHRTGQRNLGPNALTDSAVRRSILTLRAVPPGSGFPSSASGSFNISTTNFGPPTNHLSSLFGRHPDARASLGSGGQNGGLNPLYQIGGPRSAQLALKLLF